MLSNLIQILERKPGYFCVEIKYKEIIRQETEQRYCWTLYYQNVSKLFEFSWSFMNMHHKILYLYRISGKENN